MERSGPDSMLAFQNSKLKAQLEVKRDEFADLDRRHQQLVAKQASYQDNLLIIDRLWKQVNGDIQALTERATGEPVLKAEPDNPMKREQVDTKESADINEDPFLARLLQSEASMVGVTQQSLKLLWTDASELEIALRKRLKSTVESFAKVLDAIRQGQQQRTEQAQQAKAEVSLPNGAAQSVSSAEAQQALPKEAFLLTKSLEETEQLMSKRESELEQEREAGIQLARCLHTFSPAYKQVIELSTAVQCTESWLPHHACMLQGNQGSQEPVKQSSQ